MKEKKIKLIDDDPQSKVIESNKEVIEEKKRGRPTILTPELKARLLRLFEKHFFVANVAAEVGIYRQQIEEWEREQKDFHAAITHARDKWIKHQMYLLDKYAKDKKTKDWRALQYKLSIADIEYNDKKFLREAPGKRDSSRITIIINRKDLETSKIEASKVIGESKLEEEPVSLILFEEEKKEKKQEKRQKAISGEAETL